MGIVRGLSAAILYYFVPFCPMESPGSTILYHVRKVKMACSCEIERNFINILLILFIFNYMLIPVNMSIHPWNLLLWKARHLFVYINMFLLFF